MGGYQRYEAYQDSGLEWLGEIPAHWNAKRIKFIVSKIGSGKTPKGGSEVYVDSGVMLLRSQNIYDDGLRLKDVVFITDDADLEQAFSRVFASDVLLNITGASIGRVSLIPNNLGRTNVNQHVCIFRPQQEKVLPKYLYFLLCSQPAKEQILYCENGTSREGLNFQQAGNLTFAVPPLEEQKTIARFLDYKTAQIDALIAKKASLLKKLAEKRSALISQAVTKGLDPKVPMQDSGVEWLGEIPAHWEVLPLKRLADILDCKHKTVSFVDNGLPVASIAQVHGFYLDISSSKQTTEEEFSDMIEGGRKPREGDIIFSRNATVGAAALVRARDYFCMGQDVCLVRPKGLDPIFLNYCFRSEFVEVQIDAALLGATFKRINVEKVKNLLVCFPNIIEQKQISCFIENQTVKIDEQQKKVEQAIDRLKEYRTALITNAVTGSIDVRNISIPDDLQEVA
jgi:type I restriction enzyme, S subunit